MQKQILNLASQIFFSEYYIWTKEEILISVVIRILYVTYFSSQSVSYCESLWHLHRTINF